MIELDFERLAALGLTAAMAHRALTQGPRVATASTRTLSRVVEVHLDRVQLHDGRTRHAARVGAHVAPPARDAAHGLAVGDWVWAEHDDRGQAWVRDRVCAHTQLRRPDADGTGSALVANVDTALVLMGLDGDYDLRRLERCVALVRSSGIDAVVVLTKADTVRDPRTLYTLQMRVRERLGTACRVLSVDTRDADTAQRLASLDRAGQTSVLLGSCGAGKSLLTHTLMGHGVPADGDAHAARCRGSPPTLARALWQLPRGGCVIDTPGLPTERPDWARSPDDLARLRAAGRDTVTSVQRRVWRAAARTAGAIAHRAGRSGRNGRTGGDGAS